MNRLLFPRLDLRSCPPDLGAIRVIKAPLLTPGARFARQSRRGRRSYKKPFVPQSVDRPHLQTVGVPTSR